jgi:hypothetical protein
VPSRRTLVTAILASTALGEILASPSWLRSDFYAGSIGTGPPLANPYSVRALTQ